MPTVQNGFKRKILDKETLQELLIATKNRDDFIPSQMGEFRKISFKSWKPVVATNIFNIKAEGFGTGAVYTSKKLVKSAIYPILIAFYEVSYSSVSNRQHPIRLALDKSNSAFVFMENLRKSKHPVSIRCKCKDYYFTWQHWNKEGGSSLGRPFPKYIRKTPPPPEGRPLRNPGEHTGMCKHIYGTVLRLEKEGFLKR